MRSAAAGGTVILFLTGETGKPTQLVVVHVEVEIGVVLAAVRRDHVHAFAELNLLRSRRDNRGSTPHRRTSTPLFRRERNALRSAHGGHFSEGFPPLRQRVPEFAQREIVAFPRENRVLLHESARLRNALLVEELAVRAQNRGIRGVLDLDGRFAALETLPIEGLDGLEGADALVVVPP